MSRRVAVCLEVVVSEDELRMDEALLQEGKLDDPEEEAVAEEALEPADPVWTAPLAASREFTPEEMDADRKSVV